jgi:hypothetical protein
VSGDGPLLDQAAITDALRRLGDRLARRGVVADIYVFGGAAMALAYDARRSTRDIDALFQPHRPAPIPHRAATRTGPGSSTTPGCACRPLPRSTCWR